MLGTKKPTIALLERYYGRLLHTTGNFGLESSLGFLSLFLGSFPRNKLRNPIPLEFIDPVCAQELSLLFGKGRSRTLLATVITKMYYSLGPRTWNAKGRTKDGVDELWGQLMPA